MDERDRLMSEAIAVCRRGLAERQSPFGAVIVNAAGEVVSAAHNTVRASCDPTAHAEVNAIREATRVLGTIDLSGHRMFTTCEPCPMCASAIHWARLDEVNYGATISDAEASGFNELDVSCRDLYSRGGSGVEIVDEVMREECRALFDEWKQGPNPTPY